MIPAAEVAAVIPTRGDVTLNPILQKLPFEERVVWDNSTRNDLAVYGRYAAIAETTRPVIFCQDDDCILAPEAFDALLAAYQPGHVVCNMPARFRHDFYREHALVGFGALFDRDLPAIAFGRFFGHGGRGFMPSDAMWRAITEQPKPFLRTCDIVFTALTPRILVDVPYTDREFASAPNRMWMQPAHVGERTRMLDLVLQVRDAPTEGAAA